MISKFKFQSKFQFQILSQFYRALEKVETCDQLSYFGYYIVFFMIEIQTYWT